MTPPDSVSRRPPKDGGLYSVALRTIAVLLATPPDGRPRVAGITRQQLADRLEHLRTTSVDRESAVVVGLERRHHTDILELLARTQGLLALKATGRDGDELDPSTKQWARDVTTLDLPLCPDDATVIEHADALCWLLSALHRDTTPRDRERLCLPASVTGLARVLAALVSGYPTRGPDEVVRRWTLPDTPPPAGTPHGPASWPPLYLQPLAQERLGRGRPPTQRWPLVRAKLLRILAQACASQQRCTIIYTSPNTRQPHELELDPWYLAVRRGFWYLVGRSRDGCRVYRLERIVAIETQEPGSCWSQRDQAAAEAALRFDDPVGPEPARATRTAASAPPPPGADQERDDANGQQHQPEWSVPARFYALTDWAMSNPGIAQITAPDTLRAQIRDAAVRIVERHSAPPSSPPPQQPSVELPPVRDIENEQQLMTMCTVLAWHHVRDANGMDDLDKVIAWLLGIPEEQLAVVEELDILAEELERVSDRQVWDYEPLPIVALDADERVAVAAVLNRGLRLPLPEDVAAQLIALSDWLAPLLDEGRVVLEPPSPAEGRAAIWGPWLVTAQRDAEAVSIDYRARDGHVEQRLVSPWWFSAGPRDDYLYGYDHTSATARWLRLDRVLWVTRTTEEYQPPAAENSTPAPPPSGITSKNPSMCELLLEPKAWWLLDEVSVDCWPHDAGGGALVVEVETDNPGYVHQLVLRGKGHAELIAPAEGRAAICQLARQVADQHASRHPEESPPE